MVYLCIPIIGNAHSFTYEKCFFRLRLRVKKILLFVLVKKIRIFAQVRKRILLEIKIELFSA